MQIDVRYVRLQSSEALTQHVQRRLLFALDRFQQQVDRVVVRLQDTNGPRGGVDKSCSIEVTLRQGGMVRVDELGEHPYAVVDRATTRIRQSLTRTLDKQHTRAVAGIGLAHLPVEPLARPLS